MASGQRRERYTLGYDSSATTSYHSSRSAPSYAAFFLPHLKSGISLLDCGCGPGSITIGLGDVVNPGRVVGIDIGATYIEHARFDAAQQGVTNVSFQEGSVYDLPFSDGCFDAAFSHAVLNHLSEPLQALKEMYRVLKPGGVAGIRVQSPEEGIREPNHPTMERTLELVNRLYSHNGGDRTIGKRVRPLLREAGLVRVEVSASYECFGNLEATRKWAERMAGGTTQPPISEQLIELGWSSRAELEEIAAFWRAWGENPDAFRARTWREAVGWKE
jgi:ubiquinone/menaquinone biosynthesis C-methylase UbiE